jgi:hypothetical protein
MNSQQRRKILFFKNIAAFAMFILFISSSYSQQYAFDALKYSFPYQIGTARYAAMGGALGALGTDVSCMANNPAGLGMIRNTEFSVSPGLFFNFTEADFESTKYTEDKFVFNFGNLAAVYSRRLNKEKTTGVQFLNFGLSYHRTNNFNNNIFFNGSDTSFSIAQKFTDVAQGYAPGVLTADFEKLALNTFLIDTVGNTTTYENLGLMNNQVKGFSRQNLNGGSTGDIVLSSAINYGNKLFAGASFGISMLNYTRENNYTETDINDLSPRFQSLNFKQVVNVSGIGVNVKVGVVYKPLDWFRVGFAFHTPTWYGISEDSHAELTTNLNIGQFTSKSAIKSFDYNLATPWRIQGSLGFIAMKKLAIGVEYEFADYANMNLRPSSNQFLAENNYIDTAFGASHIIRLGAELKLDPFKIRAGYNFQSDPFTKTPLLTNAFHNISLGGGFKIVIGKNKKHERYLVFDLTYLMTLTSGQINANDYAAMHKYAILKTGMHNFIGTFGFQF